MLKKSLKGRIDLRKECEEINKFAGFRYSYAGIRAMVFRFRSDKNLQFNKSVFKNDERELVNQLIRKYQHNQVPRSLLISELINKTEVDLDDLNQSVSK